MPLVEGLADEWTLYCSCGSPRIPSRWNWSELKRYAIPPQAHERGYGPPEEIVPLNGRSRLSTQGGDWRSGTYSGPEVGFEEIAIDLPQARFWTARTKRSRLPDYFLIADHPPG
jgi:hypothetical protein